MLLLNVILSNIYQLLLRTLSKSLLCIAQNQIVHRQEIAHLQSKSLSTIPFALHSARKSSPDRYPKWSRVQELQSMEQVKPVFNSLLHQTMLIRETVTENQCCYRTELLWQLPFRTLLSEPQRLQTSVISTQYTQIVKYLRKAT